MYTVIQKRILENLLNRNCIGAKHTGEDDAIRCLPKHARGDGKDALKKLEKAGLILSHPTRYGTEVSLDPTKIGTIRQIIKSP
jgi:hypothetical protein